MVTSSKCSSIQQVTVPEGDEESQSHSSNKDDKTPETQAGTASLGYEENQRYSVGNPLDDEDEKQIRKNLRGPPRTISTGSDENRMFRRLSASMHQLHLDDESEKQSEKEGNPVPTNAMGMPLPSLLPSTAREYAFVIAVGTLLSFNTGFVNGSCLTGFVAPKGTQMQVSGFTTPYSLSALGLAAGDFDTFRFQLCMILSFIFGSFLAGFITPKATPYRIEPTYGPTFLVGAALLTVSSILAALELNEDFIFYLAAVASGVQNGISSTYSANLIRSSGLTGTSTDIGLFFGQLVRGNYTNAWKLVVLCCLATSFYFGGVISFFVTRKFTTLSLLFNAALFLLIGLLLIAYLCYELNISFKSAMLGTWQWQRAAAKLTDAFATKDSIDGQNEMMSQRQLEEIFEKVDVDKSGTIDREELYNALKQTGIKISKKESNFMMKHADKDGDGVLSREEWCNAVTDAYRSVRAKKRTSLRNSFLRISGNSHHEKGYQDSHESKSTPPPQSGSLVSSSTNSQENGDEDGHESRSIPPQQTGSFLSASTNSQENGDEDGHGSSSTPPEQTAKDASPSTQPTQQDDAESKSTTVRQTTEDASPSTQSTQQKAFVTCTFTNAGSDPAMAQAELFYEDTRWGPLGHKDIPITVQTYPGHRWFIVVNGSYVRLFTIGQQEGEEQQAFAF